MKSFRRYFRLAIEALRIIKLYKSWPEIISNHFKTDAETTKLTLRNGARYEIHPQSTDMGLIREIYSQNIYKIGKDDIQDGSVIIDIGAHIGVFSIFAASQADRVTVYSFEPEPDNYRLLMKNINLNHLENKVRPFNEAVSSTTAARKLIRSASSVSAHSLSPSKFTEGEIKDSMEVNCTTLADIFRKFEIERCDILKLDCEGEEYNILMSAPDEVLSRIKKITAEYHDGVNEHDHKELAGFLRARNFEVETKEGNSFQTFTVGFLCAVNENSAKQDRG